MSKAKLRSGALVAALCLGLAGCSFGPRLQGVAVNHNVMVAGAVNQLTVLNILRAKAREPLHFTTITRLNGSAGVTARGSSNVQVKGPTATRRTGPAGALIETATVQGAEVTTPVLEGVVTGNSAFEVAVLDTQEFYQGVLASVPASVVAHYLRQGWPDKLLAYVLIGQVEFVATEDYVDPRGRSRKKGEIIAVIDNDPVKPAEARRFGTFVNCYRLGHVQRAAPDRLLIPLDQTARFGLADLALLDGDRFDIDDPGAPGTPRWIKRRGRTSDSLIVTPTLEPRAGECDELLQAVLSVSGRYGLAAPAPFVMIDERGGAAATLQPQDTTGRAVKDARPSFAIQLVLRSPGGAIYFLGEYQRAGDTYGEAGQPNSVAPLLVVDTVRPVSTFVSVRFHDKTYFVPTEDAAGGRSTQVVALVQELVNLQKSSRDKPSTATVRVLQ